MTIGVTSRIKHNRLQDFYKYTAKRITRHIRRHNVTSESTAIAVAKRILAGEYEIHDDVAT